MLEPKDIEIKVNLPDGRTEMRKYVISLFPAIAGRHIIMQYPISAIPKLGDYDTNEEIMLRIMSYVAAYTAEGKTQALTSQALVDNHVPNWEALGRLECAMMEYNCSFFREGRVSGFLDDLLETLPKLLSSMLTPLLEQLSQKNSRLSKS